MVVPLSTRRVATVTRSDRVNMESRVIVRGLRTLLYNHSEDLLSPFQKEENKTRLIKIFLSIPIFWCRFSRQSFHREEEGGERLTHCPRFDTRVWMTSLQESLYKGSLTGS